MPDDSDLSINYFAVGRHELGIYRDPDTNGTSGLGLLLTLYSVPSDAHPRADGNTDVRSITLTTEHDPDHSGSNDHFAAASSRQTLLAHLR